MSRDPLDYLLLSTSVVLGLVMATRLAPVAARAALRVLHKRVALLALGTVAAHGLFLLPTAGSTPACPSC